MKLSSHFNASQSEIINKQINDFKNMLWYLNQNEFLKDFQMDDSDTPQVQLTKTLSLAQEAQRRMDNPEELLYQQSSAAKIASEFWLQVSPVYYWKGVSVVNGKKFVEFLSNISLDDLKKTQFKEGIKSILAHIKQVYWYVLEKDLDNDKFDKFDELSNCWWDIEKQYERLWMHQTLKNFTMRPYVDAYNWWYLRSLLWLKNFLWDGLYDPFKMTATNSFLDLDKHKNDLDSYVDQICKWGEKEIWHQKSFSLVKHIFSLYMKTIDNYKKFFNLSDDKVNYLLWKFKNVLSIL